ncbi:DUF177 domain-containing protein [bacterium]|nr:DUF177 domain-containing protein [bacterium]
MKIKISEIENSSNKTLKIDYSEIYEEFNKEVPVKATLNAQIIGELIKISGQIDAKLNLTCDLCLKDFTKEFNIDVEEYYAKNSLNDQYGQEFEVKENSFVEDLNGKDEIDITDFIYQSIILNIPNKLVCDINCNGSEKVNQYLKTDFTDPRLEIFKTIKIEKE